MVAASHAWSVIRIRTRAEKANADRVVPQGVGRRRQEEQAYESARPPVVASEMARGPRDSDHVAHGEDGVLIRPVRTLRDRRATEGVRIRPDRPSR
jgi:hypothetical protein